jgi:hypothetical protein
MFTGVSVARRNLVKPASSRADHGRGAVVEPADRVQVVGQPVIGEGLDQHPGAVGRQALADVLRGTDRIAHVVQGVEDGDQAIGFAAEVLG